MARSYRAVTGRAPRAIGTVLRHSYSADDTCHLWKAGIPCLLYGPGVIRGGADEDDVCVLVSEMVTATRVIAVTALDVCQRRARPVNASRGPLQRRRAEGVLMRPGLPVLGLALLLATGLAAMADGDCRVYPPDLATRPGLLYGFTALGDLPINSTARPY